MPKKRIWLYHDCKGVGVDNAYYQFVHDFSIDDGVERYYVVNGSVDAVKDKFTPEQQKNLIAFRSTKHKLRYLNAEKVITAFIEKENYLPYFSDIYSEYIDLFSGDVYYLQHGVLHAHLPWKYSYDRLDVTGEVISTNYEVKNFTENYFFPEVKCRDTIISTLTKPRRKTSFFLRRHGESILSVIRARAAGCPIRISSYSRNFIRKHRHF